MTKVVAISKEQFVGFGRRYASEEVAREAEEAGTRWARDVVVLALYGHGPEALAAFQSLVETHTALRTKRPQALAAKVSSIASRESAESAARVWVGKVRSLLATLARTDAELASQVNAALPNEQVRLDASIGALRTLLEARAPALPASARAADRIAEAPGLLSALASAPGAAATAKTAPQAETAELDFVDGQIYVTIRDLNAAARRAIAHGELHSTGEYVFHYLTHGSARKRPAADPTPVQS